MARRAIEPGDFAAFAKRSCDDAARTLRVRNRRRLRLAAIAALLAAAFDNSAATGSPAGSLRQGRPAGGNVIPVTSCADDGSAGTLRGAVGLASSGDTVDLSGLSCSTITLASGAIESDVDDLTIAGPGESRLTIDAGHTSRIFLHGGAGTLAIMDLAVANGSYSPRFGGAYGGACLASTGSIAMTNAVATGCVASASGAIEGGALFAFGGVTLYGSAITGSSAISLAGVAGAAASGGAIFAYGNIELHRSVVSGNGVLAASGSVYGGAVGGEGLILVKYSTVRDNSATTGGGASAYAFGGGMSTSHGALTVSSTFEGNVADIGGAMDLRTRADTAVLINSTLSGNRARIEAGGVLAEVDLVLENCTIAFNDGGAGGGGVIAIGTNASIQSTIIAENTPTGAVAAADLDGSAIVVGANDLIERAGIAVPPDTITSNPELAPLAANGGATRTHALLASSPAIDTGNNVAMEPFDQRGDGFPREIGPTPDIGAYERHPDAIFDDGFDAPG